MARMELQQIAFLLILAGALYLFVSERLRVDVTAMLTLLALALVVMGGPMWPSLGTRSARVVAPCGFAVLAVAL